MTKDNSTSSVTPPVTPKTASGSTEALPGLSRYLERVRDSKDPMVQMGARWLKGEVRVTSLGQVRLTPKQVEFVNSKSPHLLLSGGFRCGKTVALAVKLWFLCNWFPKNQILLGRKSRTDLDATTLATMFDVFPQGTYEYRVGPGIISFPNGSQIHCKGLDTDVGGDDTKKASQKIKGMTLGGAALDQLEEISQGIYTDITGRLTIDIPYRPIFSTTNPATYWAYEDFKASPRKGYELIETGMLDNQANLPEGFIEEQMTKPKSYVDRFVLGIWDPTNVQEGRVFPDDHINASYVREPIREVHGIRIFEEPRNAKYHLGIDPSTGAEDPCAMVMVDTVTGREVACFTGHVNVQAQVEAAHRMCVMYSQGQDVLAIPEVNGVGQAFIESFKKFWNNIYVREVYSKRDRKKTDKLGFYSTYANKTQLIEHFKELQGYGFPKISNRATIQQLQMFVYTDEAKKYGASCPPPYHDDLVMATLFAFMDVSPRSAPVSEDEEFVLYGRDID